MPLHNLLIKTLSAENDLRRQVSSARRQEEALILAVHAEGPKVCPSSK